MAAGAYWKGSLKVSLGRPTLMSSLRKPGPIRRGLTLWHSDRRLLLQPTTVVMGPCFRRDDNVVASLLEIFKQWVGWAKRKRAHPASSSENGGHGASAPFATLQSRRAIARITSDFPFPRKSGAREKKAPKCGRVQGWMHHGNWLLVARR